jgi:hypothetical protein
MSERVPPKIAEWLLRKWGTHYRAESLAGDLVEQYWEGRSRAWYWRQVVAAVSVAQARAIRGLAAAAGRLLARLIAEAAAVLSIVVVVDQVRRAHSPAGATSMTFVAVLAGLITAACIGYLISVRPRRHGRMHALLNAWVLAFGVIALGAGTLTWADTLRADRCFAATCVCPTFDHSSIDLRSIGRP